jgi:hypothetical protein
MTEVFGMLVFMLILGLSLMALAIFAVLIVEGVYSLFRGKDNGDKGA